MPMLAHDNAKSQTQNLRPFFRVAPCFAFVIWPAVAKLQHTYQNLIHFDTKISLETFPVPL